MRRIKIRDLFGNAELVAGMVILLAFAAAAILAPVISPPKEGRDPYLIPSYGFQAEPMPPSAAHPLGTLPRQYDILYGLVWGARVAFRLGLLITAARAIIGILVGLLAGFYGGLVDATLMRLTDAFMSFPVIAAAMLAVAFYGGGIMGIQLGQANTPIHLALALFGWMPYARLIRGNILGEKTKEYIEAAISTGTPTRRLAWRHLLPNATRGLFAVLAGDVGGIVVLISVFSFLGFMGRDLRADWGQMLSSTRDWIIAPKANPFGNWFIYIPTCLAIVLFSAGWSLLGEGLRRLLDPRAT